MKKLIFAAALLVSCTAIQVAHAQIGVRLNLNIGSQPDWGPVGYDHADYYYMPDVDAYYDVPAHQYVYYENNVWVHRSSLPARYGNYNPYNSYKVVINRPNPWLRNSYYRQTYANYRGRRDQVVIRDSRDAKYRNHWKDNNGYGRDDRRDDHHDNGNHYGDRNHGGDHDNGRGHGNGHGHGRDN
ncbi:hypothetical protein [Mucilaginibacter boryungensis]|uniref:YXWGXW repeat-containing protein n=1 Tax=Mucilaginibacter boryungensis TaxID=768480 RepID=A0ABR9XM87_9SPHI|nr:hypothetical protein [Mucilaginibacter boryungensis]MBE9668477.1 hypothetical protein [Mucilaginibacter boryungensis]